MAVSTLPLSTHTLHLGRVTYTVDRVERHGGHDVVYYWITTSGLRRDEHVENGGELVRVTRECWEAVTAALQDCAHSKTSRGADIPRRWGSYQSEVCQSCGAFRRLTHHGEVRSGWSPASDYAAAIEEDES